MFYDPDDNRKDLEDHALRQQRTPEERELRDQFALYWVAAGDRENLTHSEAAKQAYDFADAMMEERAKRSK